jgi:hypothetical protein
MLMPDKIDTFLFAPCGMNCMVCYVHLKDKKPCHGCLGDDAGKPERCRVCKIKDCAKGKGLTYCYECSEFPCIKIKNLEKSYKSRYNTSLLENSKIVKDNGVEYFLKTESKKWICRKCGSVVSLHDRICSGCNEKQY